MGTFAALSRDAKAELWACLSLRHAEGIGARRAKKLVEAFGSALAAVQAGLASPDSWSRTGAAPARVARAFAAEKWRDKAGVEWRAIQKNGSAFLLFTDPEYPELLREIVDAPLILYYSGDIRLLRGPAVGVVGARRCTREGIAVSAFLARDLSRAGVAIVSGMAEGIDRAAHLAGLEGPGRSIAVLGTGIDVVYPPNNADLAKVLARDGLLLSEFAPGTPAGASHFPIRNRLISALSQGVLVVEAAARSGSLITARLALEQGREVFAVPGHTMAAISEGCRELIRQGAKAVFCADDILQDLAPLLTREAVKALEKRRREARSSTAPARDPAKQPYDDLLAASSAVLPEDGLPWRAPQQPVEPGASVATPGGRAGREGRHPGGPAELAAQGGAVRKRTGGRKSEGTGLPRKAEGESPAAVYAAPAKCPSPGTMPGNAATPAFLTPEERVVLEALDTELRHIDTLARGLGVDVSRLSGLLAVLEVRGLVRRAPGMLYSLP